MCLVLCHSQEYFLFVTIAGCVLAVFIVCPTVLLILYPTRLFRGCVSCCGFRRWHALHMFVESFQGQYKDGTNGTRDFRMVLALFLIFSFLASFIHQHYSLFSSGVQCILFVGGSCLYAVLRPYKSHFGNNIDFLILILLEILSLTFVLETNFPASNLFTYCILVSVLLLGIPHITMVFYVCFHLVKKTGLVPYLKEKCKALKRYICTFNPANQADMNVEAQSVTDSLPLGLSTLC